ncbi:MAG: GntR family transcriptional regulator [Anaerolineales bacterium]|nr:GntR family transcriptional regulator [Anaerolineales bacterium]
MARVLSTSQRLHENLARLIADSAPGERLPSEPELARRLSVSRATLREAMRAFETQGMIYRRQGSGTYVTHPTQVIESGLEALVSIETLARRIGLPVSLGELEIDRRLPTEEEVRALNIEPEDAVIYVKRVIMAHNHSAAYLVDTLPENVLSPNSLEAEFTGSVLDLLLKQGNPPLASSRCEINAVTASTDVARAMHIQRGDVLLRFVAYLYDSSGRVVDYSYSYFLPGYFRFHVVRRV